MAENNLTTANWKSWNPYANFPFPQFQYGQQQSMGFYPSNFYPPIPRYPPNGTYQGNNLYLSQSSKPMQPNSNKIDSGKTDEPDSNNESNGNVNEGRLNDTPPLPPGSPPKLPPLPIISDPAAYLQKMDIPIPLMPPPPPPPLTPPSSDINAKPNASTAQGGIKFSLNKLNSLPPSCLFQAAMQKSNNNNNSRNKRRRPRRKQQSTELPKFPPNSYASSFTPNPLSLPAPRRLPLLPNPPVNDTTTSSGADGNISSSNNNSQLPNTLKPTLMDDWPVSVTEYISRCFSKYTSPVDKEEITVKLHQKILNAGYDGSMWVKDWSTEPLPMLEKEINAMTITPTYRPTTEAYSGNWSSEFQTSNKKPKIQLVNFVAAASVQNQMKNRISPQNIKYNNKTPDSNKYTWTRNNLKRPNGDIVNEQQSPNKAQKLLETPTGIKNNMNSLSGRFKKNKRGGKNAVSKQLITEISNINVDKEKLEKRAARFTQQQQQNSPSVNSPLTVSDNDNSFFEICSTPFNKMSISSGGRTIEHSQIIGTCQTIEKQYLRLTSTPNPSTIRPLVVLKQALDLVKNRWITDKDYEYTCNQLKSIRQDLTVQGIRDKFAVEVYETHARISLEKGDYPEFNQCQSQLKLLHIEVGPEVVQHRLEFLCYHALYSILTKDSIDLAAAVKELLLEDQEDTYVKFGLNMCTAWTMKNYCKLFEFYKTAPGMAAYIMDLFLGRERKDAFAILVKSYRQFLSVTRITDILKFDDETQCLEFLTSLENVIFKDPEQKTTIDCKATFLNEKPVTSTNDVVIAVS